MFDIVSILQESRLFSTIEVLELIDEETVKTIRVKAKVIDDTILFIMKYSGLTVISIHITGKRKMEN